MLRDTSEGKYQAGERWNYRARPGEEDSLLTVLKVESSQELGLIVHVRLDGLRIQHVTTPGGIHETFEHMPFAEAAIDASVTSCVATVVPVAPGDGYEEWRRAFDAGNAGIFTITVAEAVDFVAQVLSAPSSLTQVS